jgi:hypothetical protein
MVKNSHVPEPGDMAVSSLFGLLRTDGIMNLESLGSNLQSKEVVG